MPATMIQDALVVSQRRPRRPLFAFFYRHYSLVVASFVTAIVLVSVFPHARLLALACVAMYWLYVVAKAGLQGDSLLSTVYKRPGTQFIRSVALIASVTAFMLYMYRQTGFLGSGRTHDSLWLLILIGALIMSQSGTTERLCAVLLIASAAVAAVALVSEGPLSQELLSSIAAKVLWFAFLAFLLHMLVRQVADWYANVQLLNTVEHQLLGILSTQRHSEGDFWNEAVTCIARVFGFSDVNLLTVCPARKLGFAAASSGAGKALVVTGYVVDAEDSIVKHVLETGEVYVSNNVLRDDHYFAHQSFPATQAELAAPITVQGRIEYVLDIQVPQRGFFLDHDIAVMKNLASYLGRSLDIIRLQSQLSNAVSVRQKTDGILERITQRFLSQTELDQTLRVIAEAAHEEFAADIVCLHEHNPYTGQVAAAVYAGEPYDPEAMRLRQPHPDDLVRRIIASGEDHYHESVDSDSLPLFAPSESHVCSGRPTFVRREGIVSRAAVRLQTDAGCFGVMFLNYRTPRSFDARDIALIHPFANLAALAIHKAQTQRRAVQSEREDMARRIHDTLLSSADGACRLITETLRRGNLGVTDWDHLMVARQAIIELMNDVHYLNDAWLDQGAVDLHSEVDSIMRRAECYYGVQCHLTWAGAEPLVSASIVPHIKLVLNEAVLNAIHHGRATQIDIDIHITEHQLQVSIQDNGVGFDTQVVKPHGLASILERARQLAGQASIQSAPRKGTRIDVVVPI